MRIPLARGRLLAALGLALVIGAVGSRGIAATTARGTAPKPRTVAVLRQDPSFFRADGPFIAWETADRRGCKVHVLQTSTKRRASIQVPVFAGTCLDDLGLNGPSVLWTVAQRGHTELTGIAYYASFSSPRARRILKIHEECGDCPGIEVVAGDGNLVVAAIGAFRKVVGGRPRLLFRVTATPEDVQAARAKGPGWQLADVAFHPSSIAGGTIVILKFRRFRNVDTEETSTDYAVELRRLANGQLRRTFPLDGSPDAISVSGPELVAWRCCYVFDLYDLATGTIQATVPIGSRLPPRATPTGVVFFDRKQLRFRRSTGETSVLAQSTGLPIDLGVTGHRALWVEQTRGKHFRVRSIRLP